jgi:hypothetical protein
MKEREKPAEFRLERKGGDATEDQTDDEDCEPEPNAA